MQVSRRALLGTLGWTGLISGLLSYLNVNWSSILNDCRPENQRKFPDLRGVA